MAICSTCNKGYDPDDIPGTHPYRHPVNGPLPPKAKEEKGQGDARPSNATVANLPTDPVLRATLIRLGVIKTTDLTQTEQELAATGMVESRDMQRERVDGAL